MATLPTIPGPFTDLTAPTMAQLRQLGQAVSFISDCTVRPNWHLYQQQTGMTLAANTWNGQATNTNAYTVAYDNDGVAGAKSANIVTQGYYAVEACFGVAVDATSFTLVGAFLWTAGANNPHFTSGTTLRFGARGGNTVSDNSSNTFYCTSDICPNVCYPGDSIQPQINPSVSITMKTNTNDSWNEGRFVANFTGMWIAEGT